MNTGMELMGMKECRECGDPYTVTMDDAGICAGCAGSHELAALKARVAELERERDMAIAERNERQKTLEVTLEERTSAFSERNWANERHDEARADAARLREALEDIARVAHRGSAAASLARAAIASTPAYVVEPSLADVTRERDALQDRVAELSLDLAVATKALVKISRMLEVKP